MFATAKPAEKPARGQNRSAVGKQNERDRSARIMAEKSLTLRDIADDRPDCANAERRAAAVASLEFFCRTYLSRTFSLPWSPDHRKVLEKSEIAARWGGQYGYAMPRGSGKTSIAEAAALWAALFGFRRYILAIGSDEKSATEMLNSIKVELETNDLLDEDFHFVCGPIRAIGGIAHRCKGQLWRGIRTHVEFTNDRIVFTTISGSAGSAAIIEVAGLTGRIRGRRFKRLDGIPARPDLVILDDPQTDESARSPSQVHQRERLINNGVMNLGGPGQKISAIMPCTVICPNDLADRLLDRSKHPEWQGERAKMMYSMPASPLWEKYAQIRADSLRAGNGGRESTEFYGANREAMDAGAQAAWADRKREDELSAVQHAMNLKLDLGDAAFAAEYQNTPLVEQVGEDLLSADEIAAKTNRIPRGIVPHGHDHITAFIDVQGSALYWLAVSWSGDFSGAVLNYGAFPDQKRNYFTLADIRHTLAKAFPKAGQEAQIYAGLEALTDDLLARTWIRDGDGAEMKISRCLIDANWGNSTDTVYKFCRQSKHNAIVMPSHGKYIGAKTTPFDRYIQKAGEKLGDHWLIPSVKGKRAVRHVTIDVNHWKSFVHARLKVMMGDKGCLSLWGSKPEEHRLLSEHLTAEYGVKTTGKDRSLIEWSLKPGRPDNHFFDCLVGNAVAASLLGVRLNVQTSTTTAKRATPTQRRQKVYYDL